MIFSENVKFTNSKNIPELTLERTARIGDLSHFDDLLYCKSIIESPGSLLFDSWVDCRFLGAFSFVNQHVTIRGVSQIGRYSMFAPHCTVGIPEHPVTFLSSHLSLINNKFFSGNAFYSLACDDEWLERYQKQWSEEKESRLRGSEQTTIGSDVWIGQNAIILRNVHISDGAVVAAGSVVTKDVAPYTIVGGNPARVIRQRFPDSIVERLLKLQWWDYTPDIFQGLDIANPTHELLDALEENMQRAEIFKPDLFEFDAETKTVTRIDSGTKERTLVYHC